MVSCDASCSADRRVSGGGPRPGAAGRGLGGRDGNGGGPVPRRRPAGSRGRCGARHPGRALWRAARRRARRGRARRPAGRPRAAGRRRPGPRRQRPPQGYRRPHAPTPLGGVRTAPGRRALHCARRPRRAARCRRGTGRVRLRGAPGRRNAARPAHRRRRRSHGQHPRGPLLHAAPGRTASACRGGYRTARAAAGAQSGVVLLLDDDDGRALAGPGIRVPLGVGLLGSVARTGIARRGRIERDGPPLADGEPECRTYMAVPFNVPDSVCGVLALYDRVGDDEFDDADLVTLRTFAGQAAIAVENVRVHEEAQRLSHTDALTSLYNYRTLRDSRRREVERASRFGHPLCVLALDLDRFKDVNDSYGHAAGDVVLVEFARRIRSVIREVDLAFRRGGEEFVVLLPETDAVGGTVVADRINAAVRDAPIAVPPNWNIPVTVSIGIAVFPEHGLTGMDVLGVADDALYAAKAAGRDTFQVTGGPQRALHGAGR